MAGPAVLGWASPRGGIAEEAPGARSPAQMGYTRVKICGVTRPEDARAAARLGADAIGIVLYPASPRALGLEAAHAVTAALPPFVTPVGLFLDPSPDEVRAALESLPLELLQFHGTEPAAFCRAFGRPYIKAVGMAGDDGDVAAQAAAYPDARALLVDSHAPGSPGGTGAGFDWQRLPRARDFRVILAGGLTSANVAAAVAAVQPDAVDVSSGVERSKGIKDEALVHEFIEEVRRGDRNEA